MMESRRLAKELIISQNPHDTVLQHSAALFLIFDASNKQDPVENIPQSRTQGLEEQEHPAPKPDNNMSPASPSA